VSTPWDRLPIVPAGGLDDMERLTAVRAPDNGVASRTENNLDNEGRGRLRLHYGKARPWPGPRLGPLRQRRDSSFWEI